MNCTSHISLGLQSPNGSNVVFILGGRKGTNTYEGYAPFIFSLSHMGPNDRMCSEFSHFPLLCSLQVVPSPMSTQECIRVSSVGLILGDAIKAREDIL